MNMSEKELPPHMGGNDQYGPHGTNTLSKALDEKQPQTEEVTAAAVPGGDQFGATGTNTLAREEEVKNAEASEAEAEKE